MLLLHPLEQAFFFLKFSSGGRPCPLLESIVVIISSKRMRCFLEQTVKGLFPGVLCSGCTLGFCLKRWDGEGRFSSLVLGCGAAMGHIQLWQG